MGSIKNDTKCAMEISNNIKATKSRLKPDDFKFSGYLTSRNVSDDTTCNLAYDGGINALETVAGEVSRTAGFIDEINYTLTLADNNIKKLNRKPLNENDNVK